MIRFLLALLLMTAALPASAEPAHYVVGLLYRGDQWTNERSARIDSLQAGHMANIVRRYEEGWLVGSGPVLDAGSTLRGVFFFKADSVEQVVPLVATDPAIAAGRLRVDLREWSGPAGLGEQYRQARAKNPAMKDSMMRYVIALTEPVPGIRKPSASHSVHGKALGSKLILWGPLDDGRELAVLATADTSEGRAWLKSDPSARKGEITTTLRPWMVARGVIPGH